MNNYAYRQLQAWRLNANPAFVHDGQEPSWSDLADRSHVTATSLRDLGVRPRDYVMMVMDDRLEWLCVFYGLVLLGAIPVIVMPNAGREYVSEMMARIGIKHIIIDSDILDTIDVPLDANVLNPDHVIAMAPTGLCDIYHYQPDDVWAVLTSSGTTNAPKLIAHRHDDLDTTFARQNPLALTSNSRVLTSVKLASSFGMIISILGSLALGYTSILMKTPRDFRRIHDIIDAQGITNAMLSPKMIDFLIRHKSGSFNQGLRAVYSTGEALLPITARNFRERFGFDVLDTYGCGEIRTWAVLSNTPDDYKSGSLGRVGPGAVCRLLRPDGSECHDDEIGELVVTHSNVALGYLGDPIKTQQQFQDRDYRTGDYMYRDRDGYFFYAGRREQLININDSWVSCLELENRINQVRGVTDAVVIRQDSDMIAFVLCDDDAQIQDRRLKQIYRVSDLPITDTNKKVRSFETLCKYVVES